MNGVFLAGMGAGRIVAVVADEMFVLVGDVVHQEPQPLEGRHQLVVALQCGMQFGTVDDYAGSCVVAHLLERERAADHVAGEA